MTGVTLRFYDRDLDLPKVGEAERLLHEAGVYFDTGMDVSGQRAIPEWKLDFSLENASVRTNPLVFEISEIDDERGFYWSYLSDYIEDAIGAAPLLAGDMADAALDVMYDEGDDA